jgi:hypothetical protein
MDIESVDKGNNIKKQKNKEKKSLEKMPLKITISSRQNNFYKSIIISEIHITSLTDSIIIEDIIVNRNNCKVNRNLCFDTKAKVSSFEFIPCFPKKIKFGEVFNISVKNCDVIEIKIITNKGVWIVKSQGVKANNEGVRPRLSKTTS